MLNPILAFSTTRRMRSFKTLLIVAAYLTVMLAVALLIMGRLSGNTVNIYAIRSGVDCYNALMIAQFALIVLIAPAMTSGAIAGERERQTLELLLVTNTRSFRIVMGKALESFAMLGLLIISGLPVMCLAMMTGAVTILQILGGTLFLLAVAFAAVCVGVLASSLARSTVVSTVVSYLFILVIMVVTTLPVFIGFSEEVTDIAYNANKLAAMSRADVLKMISPLLFFNPGYGLAALLQGQTNFFGGLLAYHDMGRILCAFKLMNSAGGEAIALISCAAIVLLGFLLLLAATAAVRGGIRRTGKSGKKTVKERKDS